MTPSDASTPPAPSAARAAGSALAGHRIEAVLHAGPVFTVYRAVDALGIERVALKEYCPRALCARDAEGAPCLRDPGDAAAHAAFEAGRAAFVEEMRRLERLRLPGVVRVRDLVEAEGSLCALMPLLPGVALNELPPSQNDDALHAMLLSLVEPLAQLHAAGLVHGALHARQLLWSPGRAPVLLGFGLAARALGVQPQPDDRAPELRTPGAAAGPAVGPWTDLYALAAMVLRQLTGRPWDEATAASVAVLLERVLGPARDAGKRQVLVKALQGSLASAPAQRPRHAGELRAQLVAAGVSRSARPAGAAQPPSPPPRQPGEAGRAASPRPEAMARGAPEAPLPALRPDGSCVIPPPPRRRDDSRRNAVLVLLLATSCVASGWWVRGLWTQEQERQRIDRMLISAATPPSWDTAPAGDVDAAGLPPSPVTRGPADFPAAPATPGEPRPPEAAAEVRAPAGIDVTAAGAGAMLPGAGTVPAPAATPAPAVVAQAEPAAVTPAAAPVPEAPAAAQAVPVAAPAAPAPALQAPVEVATAGPATAPAVPAAASRAIAPAPVPAAAAKADKPVRVAVLSPAPAPKPAPAPRATAQPSSRASVQPAERRAQQAQSKRVASRAKAPAARSARAPSRPVATASSEPTAGAATPRSACGTAAKYALLQCLKRQCSQSSQREHPQCQRLLRDNEITS